MMLIQLFIIDKTNENELVFNLFLYDKIKKEIIVPSKRRNSFYDKNKSMFKPVEDILIII